LAIIARTVQPFPNLAFPALTKINRGRCRASNALLDFTARRHQTEPTAAQKVTTVQQELSFPRNIRAQMEPLIMLQILQVLRSASNVHLASTAVQKDFQDLLGNARQDSIVEVEHQHLLQTCMTRVTMAIPVSAETVLQSMMSALSVTTVHWVLVHPSLVLLEQCHQSHRSQRLRNA